MRNGVSTWRSNMSTSSARVRVTVTVAPDLLRRLSRLPLSGRPRSRSQVVEEALRLWLREHARRDLESQIEEYYRSLSPSDREDDRKWTALAAKSAAKAWHR